MKTNYTGGKIGATTNDEFFVNGLFFDFFELGVPGFWSRKTVVNQCFFGVDFLIFRFSPAGKKFSTGKGLDSKFMFIFP